MTTVVCDASPLIFLAKLDRLDLVRNLLGERVVVLRCVADDLDSEQADPVEAARLRRFLESTEVIATDAAGRPSRALSQCDEATLAWAVAHRAAWLLADERLLRRIAVEEGLRVMGFVGLLVAGARDGVLSTEEARAAVDEAVSRHGCRISIALYRRVMETLGGI